MRVVAIISWIMYGIAWMLPALILKCHGQTLIWPGYECVLRGLLALLIAQIEILANPLFIAASCLLLTPNKKIGAAFAITALIVATQTFTLFKVDIYLDEGGVNIAHLNSFGPGFYLWYSAIVLVAVAACVRLWRKSRSI